MDKNHSHNLSEEKLDRFAKKIARNIILTDEEIDEIAESPRLWWQVQSRIAEEKARHEKQRFFIWRWQFAGTAAFAVLIVATAAFWFFNPAKMEIADVKDENQMAVLNQKKELSFEIKSAEMPILEPSPVERKKSAIKTKTKMAQTVVKSKLANSFTATRKPTTTKNPALQKSEIATDFIALSYLPATESGQVVRVKVPRSMLVSLGVTTNVEKPSELINAEVIVGDDGATRAIRFLAN